jgi:hypothetical protein
LWIKSQQKNLHLLGALAFQSSEAPGSEAIPMKKAR